MEEVDVFMKAYIHCGVYPPPEHVAEIMQLFREIDPTRTDSHDLVKQYVQKGGVDLLTHKAYRSKVLEYEELEESYKKEEFDKGKARLNTVTGGHCVNATIKTIKQSKKSESNKAAFWKR